MTERLLALARRVRASLVGPAKPALPLAGYTSHRTTIRHVDPLRDEDLAELNRLLPWQAFTVDAHGRRFGGAAWTGKRDTPQAVPDRRVVLLDEVFSLAGKDVLEVGCFEGIHTIALAARARSVTAVDARIDNVVKTIVRASLYGFSPTIFQCDLETDGAEARLGADVALHVGVLYHLRDPVRHLLALGRWVRLGVVLDTHVATLADASNSMTVDGKEYRYRRFTEGGVKDAFSGMYDHAKWLTLPAIVELLELAGFAHVTVVEERAERNGPRVLLVASKHSVSIPSLTRE